MNVHHAIIAHTYTWHKNTLASTGQAFCRAILNSMPVCVCLCVNMCACVCVHANSEGGGGPRGQTGSMAESTVCLVAFTEKWRSLLGTQSSRTRLAHTHTLRAHRAETEKGQKRNNAVGKIYQQVGGAALERRLVVQDTRSTQTLRQRCGSAHSLALKATCSQLYFFFQAKTY